MNKNLQKYLKHTFEYNPNEIDQDEYYFNNIHQLLDYISAIPHSDSLINDEHGQKVSINSLSHCMDFLIGVDKALGIPYEDFTKQAVDELAIRLRLAGFITRDEAPDNIRSYIGIISTKDAAEQKLSCTQGTLDFPLRLMDDWLSGDPITVARSSARNQEYIKEWLLRHGQIFTSGTIEFPDATDDMIQ